MNWPYCNHNETFFAKQTMYKNLFELCSQSARTSFASVWHKRSVCLVQGFGGTKK